jgi:hypothetical protein
MQSWVRVGLPRRIEAEHSHRAPLLCPSSPCRSHRAQSTKQIFKEYHFKESKITWPGSNFNVCRNIATIMPEFTLRSVNSRKEALMRGTLEWTSKGSHGSKVNAGSLKALHYPDSTHTAKADV